MSRWRWVVLACVLMAATFARGVEVERILDGTPAEPGRFPYMGALTEPANSATKKQAICSGMLITRDVVLTAAHCLAFFSSKQLFCTSSVDIRTQPLTCREVVEARAHPEWRDRVDTPDLALLKLNTSVGDDVRPIEVSFQRVEPGAEAVIVGYGTSTFTPAEGQDFPPPPPELLQATTQLESRLRSTKAVVVANDKCNLLRFRNIVDNEQVMCAETVNSSNQACRADSGGALVLADAFLRRDKLIGIVSFNLFCDTDYEDGFVRLSEFESFVRETVRAFSSKFEPSPSPPPLPPQPTAEATSSPPPDSPGPVDDNSPCVEDALAQCNSSIVGMDCLDESRPPADCCRIGREVVDCLQNSGAGCPKAIERLLSSLGEQLEDKCTSTAAERLACFPASATVELETGQRKRMDELRIGDRVRVTGSTFSPVFAFSHRQEHSDHTFLSLKTANAELRLTSSHLIYCNGRLTSAANMMPGDVLQLDDGSRKVVRSITAVRDRGLYNPHTIDGRISVDGILVSTYTQAIPVPLAELLLGVPKLLFRLGVADPLFGLLDHDHCDSTARTPMKALRCSVLPILTSTLTLHR